MQITLDQVNKIFHQGRHNEFHAIHDVSLQIEAGRMLCLKGASGSGKTTLLSMIGCLSRPTSGRITLNDRILSGLPERFLTDVRRHSFGFVFQKFNLIDGLSVEENIMLPAYPLGLEYKTLKKSAARLIEHFNLDRVRQSPVEYLSGGESQRVAICRALINNPQVVIADEPTANLDSRLSQELMVLLDELRGDGKTILITSHDPLVFDAPVVDRVVEMHDGQIVEH
jgi:putative ABC transport system ATP-binding protein